MKYTESGASISECRKYRFSLWRFWDDSKPLVCWIMLNPSTADANHDDPTIRKCVEFAKRLGCGGIYVVNLFSYRATNPRDLLKHKGPVGAFDEVCISLTQDPAVEYVIAAWGRHGEYRQRGNEVKKVLKNECIDLYCLGTCKNGEPKHPLMIPYSKKLERLK